MLIFQGVTRWWFRFFLKFSPLFGVDSQFAEHIFHMGWFNHQLGNHRCFFLFSEKNPRKPLAGIIPRNREIDPDPRNRCLGEW